MTLFRFLIVAMFAVAPAFAQAPADEGGSAGLKPLPAELAADFEQRIQSIEEQEVAVKQIRDSYAEADGLMAELYGSRVDSVWAEMFRETVGLASDLLEQQDAGFDVASFADEIVAKLHVFPTESVDALQRLRSAVEFPTEEMAPADLAITYQRLWQAVEKYDGVLQSMVSWLDVAGKLDIDSQDIAAFLTREIQETAANRSTFVQLSLDTVTALREAVATLPTNQEVADKLAVNEARVTIASNSLQNSVDLMNELKLDASHYRQQLVKTTGELTSDLLSVSVLSGIVSDWTATTTELAASEGPRLVFRLIIVLLILVFFFYLGRAAQALTKKAMASSKVKVSHLLTDMIVGSVKNLVIMLGILVALSQIGISLGPLLAGLGIAGFIIGFALQDTLSNFASGMLILFYRPFDVGDFVTAGGVTGKVSHMSLVNTTFKTIDNQVLVVPNNLIWQSVITNVTAQRLRRVDLVFSVAYSDDVEKVEKILQDVVEAHELILKEPEPAIRLHELAESSVNFVCRPWVKTDDYWDVYWDLLRTVKLRFDSEGITIPFPQRQIHSSAD